MKECEGGDANKEEQKKKRKGTFEHESIVLFNPSRFLLIFLHFVWKVRRRKQSGRSLFGMDYKKQYLTNIIQ